MRDGIVEIQSLAGVDHGSLLRAMKLIHLEGRQRGRFVLSQIYRLPTGDDGGPVA